MIDYRTKLKDYRGQVLKTADIAEILGSNTAVLRAEEEGELERVTRGYYTVGDIPPGEEGYFLIANYYPNAVISGCTALFLQELSDFESECIFIDIPREANKVSNDLIEARRRTKIIGIEEINLYGLTLKVYGPERCLFEARAFGIHSEVYHKAVLNYCNNRKVKFNEILRLGKYLKGASDIISTIQAHQTAQSVY